MDIYLKTILVTPYDISFKNNFLNIPSLHLGILFVKDANPTAWYFIDVGNTLRRNNTDKPIRQDFLITDF